jgi:hypothetical protein
LEGCLLDVDLDAGAEAVLEQASARCLAGMLRLPAVAVDAGAGIAIQIADPTRCVRAAVAGTRGVRALDVAIVDTSGQRLAEAQPQTAFAWVPARGPLCVATPGTYRVVARVTDGTGRLVFAAWQAEAP